MQLTNKIKHPLVSVLIYNFNYGRFLRDCFDSVLNQSYPNIEILFSDNASTDNSWEIAVEYNEKFPGKFFLAQNRENYGTDANLLNCWINRRGFYHINLCSDDTLKPKCVEKAMSMFLKHPELGFVIFHRDIMDTSGRLSQEPPFYSLDCIVYPPAQCQTYMMAAVNPSNSQVMYRSELLKNKHVNIGPAAKYYTARIVDFRIALSHPVGYIKQPLLNHRIHDANQNLSATQDLQEILGFYQCALQFAFEAKEKGYSELEDQLPEVRAKVAELGLRYCKREYIKGNYSIALQYYHLARAFQLSTESFETTTQLSKSTERNTLRELKNMFASKTIRNHRDFSYEPRAPYVALDKNWNQVDENTP